MKIDKNLGAMLGDAKVLS